MRSGGRDGVFNASLTRDPEVALGVTVRCYEIGILARAVEGNSIVAAWNDLNSTRQIRTGTLILSVNDVNDPMQMLANLRMADTLDLVASTGDFRNLYYQAAAVKDTMPQSFLDGLPRFPARDCSTSECAICCEDVRPDEHIMQLPCRHAFHPACASKWITRHSRRCPLCCQDLADIDISLKPSGASNRHKLSL